MNDKKLVFLENLEMVDNHLVDARNTIRKLELALETSDNVSSAANGELRETRAEVEAAKKKIVELETRLAEAMQLADENYGLAVQYEAEKVDWHNKYLEVEKQFSLSRVENIKLTAALDEEKTASATVIDNYENLVDENRKLTAVLAAYRNINIEREPATCPACGDATETEEVCRMHETCKSCGWYELPTYPVCANCGEPWMGRGGWCDDCQEHHVNVKILEGGIFLQVSVGKDIHVKRFQQRDRWDDFDVRDMIAWFALAIEKPAKFVETVNNLDWRYKS